MSYHDRIIDLPISGQGSPTYDWRDNYTTGHRDARYAAAEIALRADAEIERLQEVNEKLSAALQFILTEEQGQTNGMCPKCYAYAYRHAGVTSDPHFENCPYEVARVALALLPAANAGE